MSLFGQSHLNRWCIEMALRWPSYETGGYGGAMTGGYQPPEPRQRCEEDVIGRATKIRTWVTAPYRVRSRAQREGPDF